MYSFGYDFSMNWVSWVCRIPKTRL